MKSRYFAVAMVAMLVFSLAGLVAINSYQQSLVKQENANQLLVYQNAILKDENAHSQIPHKNSTTNIALSVSATLAIYIATPDSSANKSLEAIGFVPNCLVQCPGITYYKDPTTVLTNEGTDFIQFMMSGASNAVTPVGTDRAIWVGASSSATGALVTDSFAGAGPCSITNGLITGGPLYASLSPNQGTVAAGAPSAGAVTWTVSFSFTYHVGPPTVNAGCLLTENYTGSAPYIFTESSGWGPFTLVGGDVVSEVWTITVS